MYIDRGQKAIFGLFGLFVVIAILSSVVHFSIVKAECEEAGKKQCITKALREIQGNGKNHSIDIDE